MDDEIDILQFLKKWWSFRKLIIFGTLSISLVATFFIILTHEAYSNKKQHYVTAVLKSDLGDKNSLILAAFKSKPYIEETLKSISLDIDTNKLLDNLILKASTDPLSESLKDQMLAIDDKKLKSFTLTNAELAQTIQKLNDNSKELITIQLYHKPLNLSSEQANNLILALSSNVNKNLLLRLSRENKTINFIDTKNLNNIYFGEVEMIVRLSDIVNSIQKNLLVMKSIYNSLLINYDLENLSTLANIAQKQLFEIANDFGSTFALDALKLNIKQKERDIEDLNSSLEYLDAKEIKTNESSKQNNSSNEISGNLPQLDAKVFDKILSIGSDLNLNSFRLSTVEKIQQIQQEKSNLLNQKELLELPVSSKNTKYSMKSVKERIFFLSDKINEANLQISGLTEPKSAFEIIKNPELIELNSKSITEYIKIVLILTILSFFIISFISILIPAKKSSVSKI